MTETEAAVTPSSSPAPTATALPSARPCRGVPPGGKHPGGRQAWSPRRASGPGSRRGPRSRRRAARRPRPSPLPAYDRLERRRASVRRPWPPVGHGPCRTRSGRDHPVRDRAATRRRRPSSRSLLVRCRRPSRRSRRSPSTVLDSGSVMGLQIENTVSSATAKLEDRVDARVTRDVRVGGETAVPAGSRLRGEVTLVEEGSKFRGSARLGIRFHTLVLEDGSSGADPDRKRSTAKATPWARAARRRSAARRSAARLSAPSSAAARARPSARAPAPVRRSRHGRGSAQPGRHAGRLHRHGPPLAAGDRAS